MLNQLIHFFRHLIAPPFCAYCKIFLTHDDILCSSCRMRIRPVVSKQITITKTKIINVHAIGAYDQPLVSLILAKSFGNRTTAHQLGKLLWQMSVVSHLSFDYIVPVPLHWTRYAWRGYNQAEEIAKVIANIAQKPMIHLLKRAHRAPYQSQVNKDERQQNVAGVFVLNKEKAHYKNKKILLIDDVMTSGATLQEASKELWCLKPASINAVVVART